MRIIIKALKVIGIVVFSLLVGNLFSLLMNGGYTYEVYKTGPNYLSDLHDEGFYIYPIIVLLLAIIALYIKWLKHKEKNKKT